MQVELLREAGTFDDFKDELLGQVSTLRVNLSQVRVKLPVIERVKSPDFWKNVTVADLENVRTELRGVMQYRLFASPAGASAKVIDIREDEALVERRRHKVKLEGLDMVAYRNRVQNVLMDIFDQNETLQKIKRAEPVSEKDLDDLCSLVLTQEPGLDLHELAAYFPQVGGLDQAIRGIIGLDADRVHDRFTQFVQAHPTLASHQIKFLDLLQSHIARFGSIEIDRLYEPPFTSVHNDGLDGVFDDALATELLGIIESFKPITTEVNPQG
jgi:type I restriction enzyme R subunit